ncbi:hypothetical protein [Myxococcus phage Mx4 ts27htf-1hrm-1]|nr:hypothetical protein [Myxococcus phage Mx4 ts27htf-1hrm-1]
MACSGGRDGSDPFNSGIPQTLAAGPICGFAYRGPPGVPGGGPVPSRPPLYGFAECPFITSEERPDAHFGASLLLTSEE